MERLGRRNRFRDHDAGDGNLDGIGEGQVRRGHAAVDDPIAAEQDLTTELFLAEARQRLVNQPLVDRLGREAQVGRQAVLAVAAVPQSLQQRPLHLPPEARLVGNEAGQLDAERRRDGALVGPPFRTERDAGRRAGEDHLAPAVESID